MNIIFLDIDGVLNSHKFEMERDLNSQESYVPFYSDIDISKVVLLKQILENSKNTKIVISSSWRDSLSLKEFKSLFFHFGLDKHLIIDKTSDEVDKPESIRKWLSNNKIKDFIILDDDNLFPINDELYQKFYKVKSSSIDLQDVKNVLNITKKWN